MLNVLCMFGVWSEETNEVFDRIRMYTLLGLGSSLNYYTNLFDGGMKTGMVIFGSCVYIVKYNFIINLKTLRTVIQSSTSFGPSTM